MNLPTTATAGGYWLLTSSYLFLRIFDAIIQVSKWFNFQDLTQPKAEVRTRDKFLEQGPTAGLLFLRILLSLIALVFAAILELSLIVKGKKALSIKIALA